MADDPRGCQGQEAAGERRLKIVFAGTGAFGVPSLVALVEAGMAPELVVSQPDRAKGRSGSATPPPLAEEAARLGLPLFQPEKLNRPEPRAQLSALRPDVMVVIAYGQILRPKVLAIPRLGCVNVHGSLLPRHRGASPVQAALLAGDRETGVTVMLMDEGLDSGPILLQDRVVLVGNETGGSLHDSLARQGGPLLVDALQRLDAGTIEPRPQDQAVATTCGLIKKSDARLDWTRSARELERRVRAYDPWPGAFTTLPVRGRELRVVVEAVAVVDTVAGVPGQVVTAGDGRLVVAAGEGGLALERLKPAGKRAMDADAFLRGYPVVASSILDS